MRKLKKMLLLHWYTYSREEIEWRDINFLTGDTGSGKSTIIDALQLIVLGDSSGTFFNKAANERSERTLKGYLFGETGDDGEAGFCYIRNGRFTSYVVLEWENTVRHENFVTGFIADCYADKTWTQRWFILKKHGIPEDRFCTKEGVPLDIPSLRKTLRSRYGKNCVDFYETNRAFQVALLGVYGQVKRKYFNLFRKAVPFSPIMNIEQFITESVCDVRNNIDINNMQSDIIQYKKLEETAEATQRRIEALQKIDEEQQKLDSVLERLRTQRYVAIRARKDDRAGKLKALQDELEKDRKEAETCRAAESKLDAALDELINQYNELNREYLTSTITTREKELSEAIHAHQTKIKEINGEIDGVINSLHRYGEAWSNVAARIPELFMADETDQAQRTGVLSEIPDRLKEMALLSAEAAEAFDFAAAADSMQKLQGRLYDLTSRCRGKKEEVSGQMNQLGQEIQGLKKGIKPYPGSVVALQEALRKHFHGRAEIRILADCLEIRDPSWRNAIEGYLDRQKFYLLIPPACYREALQVYDTMREERAIYDAGLIDIASLKKEHGDCKAAAGSLAEEIVTDDPDARLYANYILGRVMKCERAEDLPNYHTAITRSVMLYKNYVARRINPKRYHDPFIGRSSLQKLLEQRQKEYEKLKEEVGRLEARLSKFTEALTTAVMNEQEAVSDARILAMRPGLVPLQKELTDLKKEYAELDFTYLSRMEARLDEMKEEQDRKKADIGRVHDRAIGLQAEIRNLTDEKIPLAEGEVSAVEQQIAETYPPDWVEKTGEPRYLKERDQNTRRTLTLEESFSRSASQSFNEAEQIRKTRNELRRDYNSKYTMPYDSESESNEEYHRDFLQLSEVKLPEYMNQIKDSQQKAYEQFRDDFIAKLKENIETVRMQIRELNEALRGRSFGRDSYQFEIQPRSEYKNYYDMITDPMLMDTGGWNLTSDSFNRKYQKEIDSLFQMLVRDDQASAEKAKEYEKNIQKYTDYRTYLRFDLLVKNDQGETQRLSRMLLKKSGGETQLPFYIAMLASFSQTCRLHTQKDDTIHLIVLDEAFSKMDSERIQESIGLLRQIGLQAIFSAPSEKIGDIAPYVSRSIVVYRNPGEHRSFTRCFDPKEQKNGNVS
ncbi:MAG: hypothetical protein LKG56_04120 [Lachnospiraceae bacterium]|jgi:uncharacterized protein YPO0396|nr:hypothetical protein [Lachnospiraceae bacterium]MCH4032352.1 hypothetical protein [Lachnospiraceae bacterium]MCH4108770.1 hypothetical protein [Lachnospiraceae bacterium]MCI1302301.1 hypothetical protein [Lachnospiraceae bacterium]MCI1331467.1 hypothetical protein [Lachnospiraceae bacterium]